MIEFMLVMVGAVRDRARKLREDDTGATTMEYVMMAAMGFVAAGIVVAVVMAVINARSAEITP